MDYLKATEEENKKILGYVPKPYKNDATVDSPTHLDIAHLVQDDAKLREKANFFVCPICAQVVRDPLECTGCQSLFCKDCIDPWRRSNEMCPKKCKGNDAVEFKTVHRFVHQELSDLKFKCKSCENVEAYDGALKHLT